MSNGYGTSFATLTAWTLQNTCWVAALGPFTTRIGGAGFNDDKHEGDDTTPAGAYGLGPTIYGNAPNPGTQYPYHQLVCGDWWDETSTTPAYNTFQHVTCGTTPPFAGGSEALWTETVAYSSLAVIDYNTGPVVPGKGSAVFLHATLGSASIRLRHHPADRPAPGPRLAESERQPADRDGPLDRDPQLLSIRGTVQPSLGGVALSVGRTGPCRAPPPAAIDR